MGVIRLRDVVHPESFRLKISELSLGTAAIQLLKKQKYRKKPRKSPWAVATRLAMAGLREGEAVLDIGSGGGIDAFLAAKRVGPSWLSSWSGHDSCHASAGTTRR